MRPGKFEPDVSANAGRAFRLHSQADGPAWLPCPLGLLCAPNCDGSKRMISGLGMSSPQQIVLILLIAPDGLAAALAQTARRARRISSSLPRLRVRSPERSKSANTSDCWSLMSSRERLSRGWCASTFPRSQATRGRRSAVSCARPCIQSMSPRRPNKSAPSKPAIAPFHLSHHRRRVEPMARSVIPVKLGKGAPCHGSPSSLAMNSRRAFFIAALLAWTIGVALADDELSRIWQAPGKSVRQRAAAVNRAFTNGTPVSVVVAVLGTNYTRCMSSAGVWMGPGPEPPNTLWLSYRFGEGEVTIGTSAVLGRDLNVLTGKFTGAGYSFPGRRSTEATNRIRIGQPDGAANGNRRRAA